MKGRHAGWGERWDHGYCCPQQLRAVLCCWNDLCCVGWGIKLYSFAIACCRRLRPHVARADVAVVQLASNGSTSAGTPDLLSPATPQWTYCNPDMELFRQRRIAQQNQPMHRLSLADVITDWPSLEYIEKPEYRMPEVKPTDVYVVQTRNYAQQIRLRKWSISLIKEFPKTFYSSVILHVMCLTYLSQSVSST